MRFSLSVLLAAAFVNGAVAAPSSAWENIGPQGGTFSAIAADTTDSRHVALFALEAIWETRDNGATWGRAAPMPPTCTTMGGAEVRGARFYVNCGRVLMASRDAGRTWRQYSSQTSYDQFYQELVVHPSLPELAIATTRDGFQFTTDDGESWTSTEYPYYFFPKPAAPTFDPRWSGRAVALLDQTGVVPNTRLVQKPSLDVQDWNEVAALNVLNAIAPIPCTGRDLAIDGGGNYYVSSDCGVWVSRDEGKSWDNTVPPQMWSGTLKATLHVSSQRSGRAAVRLPNRIMVTNDGGRSWSNLVADVPVDMAMAPDGTIWVTRSGQVYRYDSDGPKRMPIQVRGIGVLTVNVADADANIVFAGKLQGSMRTQDRGDSWSPLPADASSDIYEFVTVPGQPASVFGVSYPPSHIWFSGDAGASWTNVPSPAVPSPYQWYGPILPVGPQPGVVYAMWIGSTGGFTGQSKFLSAAIRSSDGGRTWTRIDGTLEGTVLDIRPAPSDSATAYASTSAGLFRTRDAGVTWRKVWPEPLDYGALFKVDSRDPLLLYVPASGVVTVTDDGGENWRPASTPTPSDAVKALLPDPIDTRRAFALTSSGSVFETRDAALSWRRVLAGAGYGFSDDTRIAARGDSRFLIATAAGSIWSLELTKARPIALGTDLWFDPAQPGWGLSIAQHETHQLFAVWFTYDANGEPTWRFIPGGTWLDANTFTGTLYKATVPAKNFFLAPFSAPAVTPAGSATLRFSSADSGEATFNVDGAVIRQPIVRMAFGPKAAVRPGIGDLWFNPAQPGWGIGVHQQYGTVFATWFLFGTDGEPTWLFMPDAVLRDGAASGDVYHASSSAGMPYQAGAVKVTRMGAATIAGQGQLSSSGIGISWSSAISRLPF